ncbi:MAG: regulator of (H+)-ATPase in vacuolar membrane [Trizodia sp. TS-e1964]|nr:MAG: regulator of (H+)-ATPase in vacuolar membrane [Trizodia sp. TS-e1964]
MHLFSSTADFTLLSPLPHTTLFITDVNATAFYNHTEPVGHIDYALPFAVPPITADGEGAKTPRLPVKWSIGSIGYEAVQKAIGGRLKLGAKARVTVAVGRWSERLWYEGEEIGAKVVL